MSADPVMQELRRQITETDAAIVAALNRRLELVAELKRHKDAHGLPFVDRAREEELLRTLADANPGPLSGQGLRELYTELLALMKRELERV